MSNRGDSDAADDENNSKAGESAPWPGTSNDMQDPTPAADSHSPVVLHFETGGNTLPHRRAFPSVDRGFMPLETSSGEQTDSVPSVTNPTHIKEDEETELDTLLALLEQKLPADEVVQQLWKTLRCLLLQCRAKRNTLKQRVAQLEEQVEGGRQEGLRKHEALLEEYSQRLTALAKDYESRHALALERAANSRSQVDGLTLQLARAQFLQNSEAEINRMASTLNADWAEINRQEEKLSSETEHLMDRHSQELQALEDENGQLQLQLANLEAKIQPLEAANENLRRENLELGAKLQMERNTVLGQKDQLEGSLGRQESQKQDLLALLEHERGLNQDLSSSMGHQRQQIVLLEERLEAALIELKHKDRLLEAVRTEVFRKASAALGPSGHQELLRLVTVFQGSSSGKNPQADGSAKADSGVQGMSSASRSRDGMSAPSPQSSPKRIQSLDPGLADLRLQQQEKEMEVLRAKRHLRNTTAELIKLTKLGSERAKQLKQLGRRMQTPPASLSTPGGYDYRSESANPQEFRMPSSGFVPSSAGLFSRTVRKIGCRRPPHLSSTPEESLNSLADISSIRNTTDAGNRRAGSQSEEFSHTSDNVFEPDFPVRAPGVMPHRQFGIGVHQGSVGHDLTSRHVSGVRGGAVQDGRKSCRDRKSPEKTSARDEGGPSLKTISRSPWLRGNSIIEKRPVENNPRGGIWSYVPPTRDGAEPPVGISNWVREGSARRSLSFPEEPPWTMAAAGPFAFCTTAPPANGCNQSTSQEISFQTELMPMPVYLNVHLHSHHMPREV